MSVENLEDLGHFLVGDTDSQPDWLQAVLTSLSPFGDFLCLGLGQRVVFLTAKYTSGRKTFVPVYKDELSILEETETITSLLTLPVIISGGRGAASSCWNCTIAGFSSGQVRIYSETGKLLVQKCFDSSPVKKVEVQSMPEGKHFSNVLHSQSVVELLLVYPRLLVTVSGTDLYRVLIENRTHLALATAQDLPFHQLSSLPGLKLVVSDQEVSDCGTLVVQHTSYSQYQAITMQGGYVDERYKPVHTSPYFITCGQSPFLQFNDQSSGHSKNPVALATNMMSTVSSGLFRAASGAMGGIWGSKKEETEPKMKPDPVANLNVCHSVKDEGRTGLELVVSPHKLYSVVRDDRNRVMVVDNLSGIVVQAWRGYHRCQMAWTVTSPNNKATDGEEDRQLAVLLLLYLPRRGLIEVWSPEQRNKVTEFHVSKHGLLLHSTIACLDEGIPRRRESVSLYTAFLQPDGQFQKFHLPFHALTTSSSAERDFQLQSNIQDLIINEDTVDVDELVKLIGDIKNAQFRSHILSDLIFGKEGVHSLAPTSIPTLLERLQNKDIQENMSIENTLFNSKVLKLSIVTSLHQKLTKERDIKFEHASSVLEMMSEVLVTDLDEVERLLSVCCDLTDSSDQDVTPDAELMFTDCLACFETEGDLSSWNSTANVKIRLRKNIPPATQSLLYFTVSRLCSADISTAHDLFQQGGFSTQDFLQLCLSVCLYQENHLTSVMDVKCLFQTMHFLLNIGANVDDRHRAGCQDLVKRVIRRHSLGPRVFLVTTVWKCVLLAQMNQSLGIYGEEWERKLNQVRSFLKMEELFLQKLPENIDHELRNNQHTLASVFESGNSRIAEMLSRWLTKLGATAQTVVSDLDSLDESPVKDLVELASTYFPLSTNSSILVIHLGWEHLQVWTRDRDKVHLLEQVVRGCWNLSSPTIRSQYISLIWRTFFHKLLRDVARLTGTLARSLTSREDQCQDLLLMSSDNAPVWLGHMTSLLDCQLQTLGLISGTGELEDDEDLDLTYDSLDTEMSQSGLIDHVRSCQVPHLDIFSLEHQLATVLGLSWTLKVDLQPMNIFNSAESNQLLNVGPGLMAGLFHDQNVSVNKARKAWMEQVVEAAVGHIHQVGVGQYDTSTFTKLTDKLLQMGRVWFMSDNVKIYQVDSLYRAGFDHLGSELRPLVTDQEKLVDKLLEVALLRLAKHVYCVQEDGKGRITTLPSSLVNQLAERRDSAIAVAESSLLDTIALLVWVTSTLIEQDKHGLATQALSAAQILQVRYNRGGS